MGRGRIHCVETTHDDDGEHLPVVHALCGRPLLSEYTCLMLSASVDTKGGMTWDDYMAFRRKARVYPTHDRPFYTVEEFCYGEDGCDDIDCVRCRQKMDAAIKRFWRS